MLELGLTGIRVNKVIHHSAHSGVRTELRIPVHGYKYVPLLLFLRNVCPNGDTTMTRGHPYQITAKDVFALGILWVDRYKRLTDMLIEPGRFSCSGHGMPLVAYPARVHYIRVLTVGFLSGLTASYGNKICLSAWCIEFTF